MRNLIRFIAVAIALITVQLPAVAASGIQTNDIRLQRLFVSYDQDSKHANWLGDSQDDGYTGGSTAFVSMDSYTIDRIARGGFWNLPKARYAFGVGAKFQVFTPTGISRFSAPQAGQRPYAGWLTSSFAFQQRNDHIEDHFGLELGSVGPRVGAHKVQRYLHKALGWESQIKNQVTLNLRLRRAWRNRFAVGSSNRFQLDLIPEVSADMGNVYQRAGFGLGVRFGLRLPDDYLSPRADDPGSMLGKTRKGSIFAFSRIGVQVVKKNLFLDSVDHKRVVGQFEIGVTYQFARNASIQWSWTRLSDEFRTDTVDDSYGAMMLKFSF